MIESRGRKLSESGLAMLEFAMISIVLLMIIFATTLMSFAIYKYNMVASAARAASRVAMVHSTTSPYPDSGQTCQAAIDSAPGLDLTCTNVTLTWVSDPNFPTAACPPAAGAVNYCDAEVTVTYTYAVPIPFIGSIPFSVSSTSRVLVSQ